MSTLEFIDSLVGHVAWPISAIFLGLFFRRPISNLIDRIKRLSWGDKAADLEARQHEVEESAAEAISPLPENEQERDKEQRKRIGELMNIAVKYGFELGERFPGNSVPDVIIGWSADGQPFIITPPVEEAMENAAARRRTRRIREAAARMRREREMSDAELDANAEGAAEAAELADFADDK